MRSTSVLSKIVDELVDELVDVFDTPWKDPVPCWATYAWNWPISSCPPSPRESSKPWDMFISP
jgi:hypothetical protein